MEVQDFAVQQQAAAPELSRATEQEEVVVLAEEPISLLPEAGMPEQPLPDQAPGVGKPSTTPTGDSLCNIDAACSRCICHEAHASEQVIFDRCQVTGRTHAC